MLNNDLFEQVIEKYSDMVYRIALTRCGSIENAEDIFQDVFVKYSEKMPTFESEEHEKYWFIRVTINLTKNLHKSAWNTKITELTDNIAIETEEQLDLLKEVCSLKENYKSVIYLFYYEGYKVKEIAEILNEKEGTIKTWLARARDCLKDKLKGGDEYDE